MDENFDRKNYTSIYRDWEKYPPTSLTDQGAYYFVKIFVKPIEYLKKNIIEPNQKTYYWYHRIYQRVPTIDQCYTHDVLCHYEADHQFERDKRVDSRILSVLYEKFDECMTYERLERRERCKPLLDIYEENQTNWFIKYGELGQGPCFSRRAFMKQKHRLLWERRHGPVGTGKKMRHYRPDGTPYYK